VTDLAVKSPASLLVMKFGGTSMGSAERIRAAAELISREAKRRPVAVVVSAMSKVTDLLLDTMRKAEAGELSLVEGNFRTLADKHELCCSELLAGDAGRKSREGLLELLSEFEKIVRGMLLLGERPASAVDRAVAIGERLSALLMAAYLEAQGVPTKAVNGAHVTCTDQEFGDASPLMEETRARAGAVVQPLLAAGVIPVMTGFNGSTLAGRPTTLGRGGSDFSASILAAALNAAELWIWTDVDGIMTADPRLVPDARVIDAITYNEAAEMAYSGAKVLHPRTLAPLIERKIPVWSKNSFAPEKPGTRIVPSISVAGGPRAVTSMKDVALVSVEPTPGAPGGVKLIAEAIEALNAAGAEVLALTSSSYRQNFCFLIRESELEQVLQHMEQAFALELAHGYLKPLHVDQDVGLITVVGEGMRGTPGLAGNIFTAISRHKINIIAIAQGSRELTIAVVVRRSGVDQAVRAIHAECGLGEQGHVQDHAALDSSAFSTSQ